MPKLIPEATAKAILAAYESGRSYKSIVTEFGVGETYLSNLVKTANATRKRWRRDIEIDEERVAADYRLGIGRTALASKYDVSLSFLDKVLKRQDVEPQQKSVARVSLSSKAIKQIADLIAKGTLRKEIEKRFGITNAQLRKITRDNKIPTRHPNSFKRKHRIPGGIFKKRDGVTEYFIGLLAADGTLIKRTKSISYKISLKDLQLMELYVSWLGLDLSHCYYMSQIVRGKKHNLVQMLFQDSEAYDDLHALGLNPGTKSYDLDIADKSLLQSAAFWRGLLDGDGWVRKDASHPVVGLIGTRQIVESFLVFLKCNCGISGYTSRKADKDSPAPVYVVNTSGAKAARVALALWGQPGPALLRKKTLAEAVFSRYGMKAGDNTLAIELPREGIPQYIHNRKSNPLSKFALDVPVAGRVHRFGSYKTLKDANTAREKVLHLATLGKTEDEIKLELGLRGNLPRGVKRERNCEARPYSTTISINGIKLYFGTFETPDEASQVYQLGKRLAKNKLSANDIRQCCSELAGRMSGFRKNKHRPDS